jgi:hypothetical protein
MQIIGKYGTPLKSPIAVPVFEQFNSTQRLILERVVQHLNHKQPAPFVKADRHRGDDVGFRGYQFDAKPCWQLKGFQGQLG